MSENDRFDWSDDADFESLAGEPIEGFADLDDDFEADYQDDVSAAVADAEEAKGSDETSKAVPDKYLAEAMATKQGLSGAWLGFFFTSSVWLAVAGIASTSLKALGVSPNSLWRPEVLLSWNNYLAPLENPLNMLAIVFVTVFILTLVVSRVVVTTVNAANKRGADAETMLAQLTALRLENESAWQSPKFKSHPAVATFVSETLGTWRLQVARQRHLTGLEGEMHRLEKALGDNSRADLTGRFDSPAVGALSDEIVRYYDERKKLEDELAELREKCHESSAKIMNTLQDSRCWQESSRHNVEMQDAGLKRMAARLHELAQDVAEASSNDESNAAMAALKAEVEKLDGGSRLPELLEKGNKLAFQIAMEVARLGPRGERLMPMTESLEELNTEMRDVIEHESGEVVKAVVTKMNDLEGKLPYAEENNWYDEVGQFGPAAVQLAENMHAITESYKPQAERLVAIGESLSEAFDVAFNGDDLSASEADNPPAGVLEIEALTDLLAQGTCTDADNIHQPADVDPFAVTPPKRVNESPANAEFKSSTGASSEDIFGTGDKAPLPDLGLETSLPQASPDEDRVYDLEDFGAMAPTTEQADDTAEEVHDLAEFGAKPLDDRVVDEGETIHALSDFGAVRLDANSDEEVYELSTFGAVPLS